jgi:hypothetical protein
MRSCVGVYQDDDSSHDLPWIARLVAADLAKEHAFAP